MLVKVALGRGASIMLATVCPSQEGEKMVGKTEKVSVWEV